MGVKAEALKVLSFFGTMDDGELQKLAAIAEELIYRAGEEIIRENERCGAIFFVMKGHVKVSTASGLSLILGENSALGELSFIDKGASSASATAGEDCVLIRLPEDGFVELIERDDALGCKVFQAMAQSLCQKLRDTNEWLSTKDWLSDIEKEAKHFPAT